MNKKTVSFLLTISALTFVSIGCSETNTPIVTAEDRQILEEVKQEASIKEAIANNPSDYIETGTWKKHDKGIVNYYTTATEIEFINNTDFYISNISGTITYFTASDEELGTVPFTATGELFPNSTATLEVSAGEVSGKGETARITIDSVRVSD